MSSDLAFLEELTATQVTIQLSELKSASTCITKENKSTSITSASSLTTQQFNFCFKQGPNINEKLWPSSIRLAQHILLQPDLVDNPNVENIIELGAGRHALASIAAAHVRVRHEEKQINSHNESSLSNCGNNLQLIVSDTKDTLEETKKIFASLEVEKCGKAKDESNVNVSLNTIFQPLDWLLESELASLLDAHPASFDLILASDVLYKSELLWPFAKICFRLLSAWHEHKEKNKTEKDTTGLVDDEYIPKCLLSYQHRNNDNIKVFTQIVAPSNGLQCTILPPTANEHELIKTIQNKPKISNKHPKPKTNLVRALNEKHLEYIGILQLTIDNTQNQRDKGQGQPQQGGKEQEQVLYL